MQNSALSPLVGNNTTKAAIIQALIEKPLTLKELHLIIQKEINKPITYQATHKAVNEMLNEEILEKKERLIYITISWSEKLTQFAEQLKNRKEQLKDNSNTTRFEFNTFSEFGKQMLREFVKIENPDKKPSFCLLNHSWPLISMNKQDWELFNKLFTGSEFYGILANNTALDIAFEKPFEVFGKKILVNSDSRLDYDLIIKGDTTVMIYYEKEFKQKYDEIFRKFVKLDEQSMQTLTEHFLVTKTKIIALVVKDSELTALNRNNAIDIVNKLKKQGKIVN